METYEAIPVADVLPVASPINKEKTWDEHFNDFSVHTNILLNQDWVKKMTDFSYIREWEATHTTKYIEMASGSFLVKYIWMGKIVELSASYKLNKSYYNRHDPEIEAVLDLSGTYNEDTWIDWEAFGCDQEITNESPLLLINSLYNKYNKKWTDLMLRPPK